MPPALFALAAAAAAAAALGALPRASAQPFSWPLDGGSTARLNAATVSVPLGLFSSAARRVFQKPLGEEDTESMVEQVLLPSPLVTSFGSVLVVADNCTLFLLPDPAAYALGAPWTPTAQWDVQDVFRGEDEESELSGIATFNDAAFVLDGRNKAVHKVTVTPGGFSYVWTTFVNGSADGDAWFSDGDTGMLPEAETNLLWVPLAADYANPAAGIAATIEMTTGALTFVPVPAAIVGCQKPDDLGSAAVDGGNVVLLSSDGGTAACGAVALDSTGGFIYSTFPDREYLFDGDGEHTHPLFDADTSQVYFLDFEKSIVNGDGQKLCCRDTVSGFANCRSWRGECVIIPAFERIDEGFDVVDYRWIWMSMGLMPAVVGDGPAVLFVSASATELDETFLTNGTADLYSAVWAFDTSSGSLLQSFRWAGDMVNSAPLVVTGSDGTTNVYMSSTLGNIYCFSAAALANGWLWRSADLAPIPLEDLPSSTYTFLSVTDKGTLLAVSTEGGATWSDQKAAFAIAGGLVGPSPSPSPSPSSSAVPSPSLSPSPVPASANDGAAAIGAPELAGGIVGGVLGGAALILGSLWLYRLNGRGAALGRGETSGLLRVRSASMVAVAFPGLSRPAPKVSVPKDVAMSTYSSSA